MEQEETKKKKGLKVVGIIVIAFIVGAAVVAAAFNMVVTKTFKCSYEQNLGDGTVMKYDTKQTFLLEKLYHVHTKQIYDFTNVEGADDLVKDTIDAMKETFNETCKKAEGCSFSVDKKGKTVEFVLDRKFDKEKREKWKLDNNYDDYVKEFKDTCDDNKSSS